jgi:hypothetical protein
MTVFRRHFRVVYLPDSTIALDAIKVLSEECFYEWTAAHSAENPNFNYEKAFQRALTAHVTGKDGRKPFYPVEEQAILKVLRQKRAWYVSCLIGCG